ncbi:hypothetical protein EOM39_04450, partial [Candidatus Gracilibacteria bacterium]|nr:hypothetical protein [Candidatus Gracilibacteria bacterium]
LEEKNKNITPVTLNEPKIDYENLTDKQSKELLFSEKEISQIDQSLGKINDIQKLKAQTGKKDTIKFHPKYDEIKNLVKNGVMEFRGMDKDKPHLMKFQYTKLAKEYFGIGEDKIREYNKIGVHYPKDLYSQIKNKLKQEKGKTFIQRNKVNIAKKKEIQIKTGEKTKEKDINEITKEGIKIKQNNVFTRTQKKVGEKLVNESRRANVDDVTNLIREKGDKILEKGVEYAENSGMITEAEATQLRDNIKLAKENKESPITIKGDLSPTQRLSLMDLLGWDKVLKKITEQKIIIPQLRRSLKELGARLYIVGSPEGNRVKIPFSLMGNKSNTYRNVILPMIKKGALQGAKTYIEPYGGAGTSYFFADDIINSGIKDIHINHFDNEKYEVINAIKNKTIQSISGEITSAYNSIIEEIGKVMQDIPEVKSLMEKFDIKPGTSGFKIIAETYFYPQYAPDFFKERPDTKLAIRGEITESFKDWLTEKIKTEAEDQGLKLEGKDLENRVDDILNDTSLFETNYPEISKKISSVIDRFDVMDFEKGDYKTAITTSLARHFRNRGDSGQKVVSATNGFQNMIGIRDKMISGLETYQETFNKHGDKIKIYNMDGKDFIKRMGKDYNNKQSIIYLDPPYIRTTQTYIKNVTDEILKNSLDDYANTDKIDQLFNPMKDSMMMFTNDVNGKYFEALNKMLGDRMSKDILAYKEGTTPTSFITTTELSIKPRDLGLRDYDILRNKRTKEIQKALEENYLPKIAEQQKKVWAKVEQEFMKTMKEKFGDLENIQNEQFKASEALEKLEESISQAITGRDKQRIIYEARAWLKSNKVRGSEVYKIIQKIEGFIKRKSEMINGIRILKNKLLNSNTIASEIKPEIQEYINAEALEFKRITGKIVDEASIIDMINKGEISISDDNKDIYDKYINDDNYSVQIDNAIGKQSIYNMDIQQLESIVNKLKYFEEIGREILENRKKGQEIELAPLISEAIESSIKLDITEISLDRDINELTRTGKNMFKFRKLWNEFKKTVKGGMLEITPSVFIFENELGINKQVYTIYKKAFTEWVEYHSKAVEGFGKLKKELGLKKDDFNKIGLYGLANRGDGKGVIKIYSLIYNTGKNPITEKAVDIKDQEAILDIIKGFKEDSFLNESQHKMLKYMRGIFDEIGKRINLTSLETENIMMDVMKDYFPIKLDIEKNLDMETDPEIGKVLENGFKTKNIEHGFIKKATGKSVVPTIDAKLVFLSHVYKASYYAYMQKPLYQLSDLMNALGQEKIGSVGMKYFKNWIDMMAKQGKYSTKGALDRTVGNLSKLGSKSVIAFNPGSYLIQPIALLESKLVGGEISKIGTAWTNKDFKETIKKSKILPARDFRHMFGSDNILKDKANETIDIGLIPISKIDKFSASGIFYNLYHEFKKLGFKEEDCIYYADIGMEKTMANPMFDGKSLAQLKNERGVGSLFTSFMTFGANAFANRYIYGGGLSRVIKEKSKKGTTIPKQLVGKNRIKGILYGALVVGVLSFLYQQIIQELNKKMFNQKDYPETLTVKIISQIAQEIPLLGQLVGQNKYGSFLGLKGVNDILKSIAGIYNGKEDQTKTNNAYKLLFSVMQMGGFPAVVQKIWKGYFMTPSGKTGSSKSTPGKINRPKLKRPSLKMNKIRRPT